MTEVKAELVGNVWKVKTQARAQVAEEDELLILESMKMEIPVTAPRAGTVKEVRVKEGEVVNCSPRIRASLTRRRRLPAPRRRSRRSRCGCASRTASGRRIARGFARAKRS